jgi:DNA-binding response OmpR family regulator/HPt (histidine-containing phosphotransfer) domain-containing protein
MKRVLVVDDDLVQVDVVSFLLRRAGFEPITELDAESAVRQFEQQQPDLVILDVRLGEADGLDLLRQFRKQRPMVPILMLTAATDEEDKVRGLELGADDYLAKPFGHRELTARVRALLRRGVRPAAEAPLPQRVTVGPLVLDPMAHEVTRSGVRIEVTPTEFRLLQAVMARPNAVVPARTLLKEVWGHQDMTARNVLRVTASRLRAKLETEPAAPQLLHTVPGEGLLLRAPDQVSMPPTAPPQTRTPPSDAAEPAPVPRDPIAFDAIAGLGVLDDAAGVDALRQVVDAHAKTAPRRVAAMQRALAEHDAAALAREAHALRGSSAIVGAQRVASLCAQLEEGGRGGDLAASAGLLEHLTAELAVFRTAIMPLLDGLRPGSVEALT